MNEPIAARKKLIEVALPLKAINDACIHEATPGIRLHPRGLHKWWAQRRLASVRAVLFGSMVDDPSNFMDEKSADKERERLFGVIEKMVQWDSTYDERVLGAVRREISRACGKNRPEVIDPFCGNGSISLEAQRFGLYTFASDLNPVAVLITKALVEFPNVFAGKPAASTNMLQTKTGTQYKGTEGISADIMNYGNLVREEAFKRIGKYYPKRDGRNIVAWIWARKVQCPNPACRGETPLVRSFELARKKNSRVWINPVIQDSEKKKLSYTIR